MSQQRRHENVPPFFLCSKNRAAAQRHNGGTTAAAQRHNTRRAACFMRYRHDDNTRQRYIRHTSHGRSCIARGLFFMSKIMRKNNARRNHSDAKKTRMYIVRDYANTDNMYAYAIVCTTDGTYDGTEYHVIKSFITGYLESVKKGEHRATPESRGKRVPNWRRHVIYTCWQFEEAEEYIREIAHYKDVHFAQRYTNMCEETSRRNITPIKSGVVPVSRREQKRREKTAHSLSEKGRKLSALKKHGYAPAPIDLPEGLPESYGDDVTQWSREKRDELERRNVLRKYGYSV